MKLTSSDISLIVNGTVSGNPGLPASDIIIDSRQLSYDEGLIFIAIKGKNHDGHNFIEQLYTKGIRIFVVERLPEDMKKFVDAAFILTPDSVSALQKLAAYKRDNFSSPVIAVTGSAGKTIVKEWLADVLGISISVLRSPKSYNSQIGVPLSVWKLDSRYKYGIFEAGISFPGEMAKLQKVIRPDIGIITNIGDAHSENFTNNEEKAIEKLKLFSESSVIIYNSDYEILKKLINNNESFQSKNIIDWSANDRNARIFVKKKVLQEGHSSLELTYNNQTFNFDIPFNDRASIENAITVSATCLALRINDDIIRKGLSNLVSVAMRMERKTGINDCQLLEDYYNSDPGSLGMALEYLKSQKKKTTLILSDFLQSGRDEKELYSEVANLIKKAGISKFIGIGEALSRERDLFDLNSKFFISTEEFIRSLNVSEFRNEIILLKGARLYEFENIAKLLEQQTHQTVLEINLDAISHNLNEFRRKLNPGTRIMAMVKAFAYGSGSSEIAELLEYHRVSYLAVAYVDEGVELRNSGVTLPVMVMNPDPAASEIMIKYNLEPEIYSFSSFERFTTIAAKHGLLNYPVHIKVDSGMHRLGFMPEEIPELAEKLKSTDSIKIMSVFSHLAAADDPSFDEFTQNQITKYIEAVNTIRSAVGYQFIRHILNSAGIVRFPQYQFDMVRPGIGIYGGSDLEGLDLKTVGRFKTRVSQVKKIPAREPVGYGCADISDHNRTIAILPVGYADGLNRKLGNGVGELFIRGTRVPIAGNICMDMCMADITGLNISAGDEAEVFGENISISEIAEKCGTITYEILTSIPGRVKRIFYRE